MSVEIIDATIDYAYERGVQLMLVASRNQIECADLGGGYVGGFSSDSFVSYIKDKEHSSNVVVCRDHSGPGLRNGEIALSGEDAMKKAMLSVVRDVEAGFDLIHIDVCMHKGDVYSAAEKLLRLALDKAAEEGRTLLFETGTEDNVGVETDAGKFRKDLEFISEIVKPEFVVGQTASLVKEIYQVGHFAMKSVIELVGIAHEFGVRFKEHNADYITQGEMKLRNQVGVDAMNIGPELGVAQTRTVTLLAQQYGVYKELRAFQNKAVDSGKWKKWVYGSPSEFNKALIAGHYVYNTPEYLRLVEQLSKHTDVQAAIRNTIFQVFDRYVEMLA